jgi:hypothetical protein
MMRQSPTPRQSTAKTAAKKPNALQRRSAKRHKISTVVRWSGGEGVTRNVSDTGLSFDTATPPEAGRVLKVALDAGIAAPAERRQYAFCEIMVLRVTPNGEGAFRVAAAFKTSRFR